MNKKPACKINDIEYPSADKITSRISTLRRSMACTLLNRDACTPEQEQEWMKFFPDNKCAYCGQEATHLDHLHPMVRNNEPTGYGTDPGNLVPCCKKCNTPKGNMDWEDFIHSSNCEHTVKPNKTIQESIDERVRTIKDFQKAMPAKHTDLTALMKQQWKDRWNALEQELKKTEDMLMDMKIQLYGAGASGNQINAATTTGGSAGKRAAVTCEFTAFKAFCANGSASSYCTSIRKIMKEMSMNDLIDLDNSIDAAIDYCTNQMNDPQKRADRKDYSNARSALRKYKEFMESRKVNP